MWYNNHNGYVIISNQEKYNEKMFICALCLLMLTACQTTEILTQESSIAEESTTSSQEDDDLPEVSSKPKEEISVSSSIASESSKSDIIDKPSSSSAIEAMESSSKSESESVKESQISSSSTPVLAESKPIGNPSSMPGRYTDSDMIQWQEELKEKRGINDLSKYSFAINDLELKIEDALDIKLLGGFGQIHEQWVGKEISENRSIVVGIKVFSADLEKTIPIIEELLKEYNSAEGIIDIEYEKCKYSLSELNRFAKKIEEQPFFDISLHSFMIIGSKIYVTELDGYNDLEDFLADKPYKDAVVIQRDTNEQNPPT